MTRGWRFRPGLLVTVAAIAFVSLTVSLGNWQTRRAAEKAALQADLDRLEREPAISMPARPVDAEALALRKVVARGVYATGQTIFLDNKVLKGRAGYHVITPLRLEGGDVFVLVNRGWAPAGATRAELPAVSTPSGSQVVEGVAVVPSSRFVELAADVNEGPVWQNLTIERARDRLRLPLQPVVVQQTSDAGDGLSRAWERPDAGVDKHRTYALQWYSLAALTVILYVALNLKRNRSA